MSKEYMVQLPIAGSVSVYVEADSEQDAIEKALNVDWDADFDFGNKDMELDEVESYEKLIEGNVFYGTIYEAEVQEL